jgi:hypothetical protein
MSSAVISTNEQQHEEQVEPTLDADRSEFWRTTIICCQAGDFGVRHEPRKRASLLLFRQESRIKAEALAHCQAMGISNWTREAGDKVRKKAQSHFRWDKRVMAANSGRFFMSDE